MNLKTKMQKKGFFLILIIFSILASIFFGLSFKFNSYVEKEQKIDSNNLLQEIQISLIHEWTSNGRVCQYSSIVSKNDYKNYLIETVIFFNGNLDKKNLKCLVRTKKKFFVFLF